MERNLKEFRIRGIKTNIPFLENVVKHKNFLSGEYDTSFIDASPELFLFPKRKDRGTKMLNYIGTVTVNGFPGVGKKKTNIPRCSYSMFKTFRANPKWNETNFGRAWSRRISKMGTGSKRVLLTDTTFRDAHQSLLATRIRTKDLHQIAEPTARMLPNLFSAEMWGGATFDVAYRFLKEDPWERLLDLREKMPNVLFQMLLRSSNAVGYKNYPDNLIQNLWNVLLKQALMYSVF